MKEKLEIRKNVKKISFKDKKIDEILNLKKESAIYRIYENSTISIGFLKNNIDDKKGFEIASKSKKYPYNHVSNQNVQKNIIASKEKINDKDVVILIQEIYDKLKEYDENVDIFYDALAVRYTLTDSNKLHLNFEDQRNRFSIIYKGRKFILNYRKLEPKNVFEDMRLFIGPFAKQKKANIKDVIYDNKTLLIPTDLHCIYDFFEKILSCKYLMNSNLIGKQMFSKKLNLLTSLSTQDARSHKYGLLPFFDWEGSFNQMHSNILIENGKILKPYTNKDMAEKYEVENTACAYAQGDSYPGCRLLGACIKSEFYSICDFLLDKFIYIEDADLKIEEDNLIFDVKLAYVYKDGKFDSYIEPFIFKVNAYDLFGENFISVSDDYIFGSDLRKALAFKIDKKFELI